MTECEEYKEKRKELEQGLINKMGQKWVERKRGKDMGLNLLLGLEEIDVIPETKKYLKMWKRRGKKQTIGEEATSTRLQMDHTYSKK